MDNDDDADSTDSLLNFYLKPATASDIGPRDELAALDPTGGDACMAGDGSITADIPDDGILNFAGMSICDACVHLSRFKHMDLHVAVIGHDKLAKQCPSNSGAVLAHMQQATERQLELCGKQLCIFKFGITAQPLQRWAFYHQENYIRFTVLHATNSLFEACWAEAALIALKDGVRACRNIKRGGDGPLHTKGGGPPYFVYLATSRADIGKWVG